ncbi:MAG: hypothetical protein JNK82_39480 [Myxococcaceae bacterium]|nr:hypothetical protein [Myxococcaceae bacterium]
MTPLELQQALAKISARSAQVISHRVLDAKTREECAALYGLKPELWDVLFLRAVRDFERALGLPAAAGDEVEQAARLAAALTPALVELSTHRDETRRLIEKAHADYEASPSHTLEVWARRIAIVVIIALTAWFYWREQSQKGQVRYEPQRTFEPVPPTSDKEPTP